MQPAAEPPGGLLAERDEALLAALPADVHVLAVEVDVREVEPDGLGGAKAARVDELHERGVPQGERVVPRVHGRDEPLDLCERGGLGEAARPSWRQRGVRDPLWPERMAHERAHRREPPGDGRRREAAARPAELRGVGGEAADVELVEAETLLPEPPREVGEIRSVRPARRLGESRACQEPVDRGRRIHGYRVRSASDRSPLRILFALAVVAAVAVALVTLRTDADDAAVAGGGAVTLVGDSLNVGVEPYLRAELAGWSLEAFDLVGRATAEGVEELRRVRASLAPIVVVSLGTNDADGTEERFRALVAEALRLAGDDRCVVWATVVRDGAPRDGFNEVLVEARETHPSLRLVDWAALVDAEPGLLAADLVHGTPEGYVRRATATARVARACAGA